MRRVFPPAPQQGARPPSDEELARQGFLHDPSDPKAPPVKMVDYHALDITIAGKDQNGEPIHKDLPPYYVPQAMWYFLPRLVVDQKNFPQSRTYMFAIYNNERREVMNLYVDKSTDQDVYFNGQRIHAVTVTERIGLGGDPIVHYLTPEGKYLGCEDKAQHLTTVLSTEQDVLKIWPKANLTRPQPLQPPNTGPSIGGAAASPASRQEATPATELPAVLR